MTASATLNATMLQNNLILRGLLAASVETILKLGSLQNLRSQEQIAGAEKTVTDIYFPLTAILAITVRMNDGREVQIGTIGREGMSGYPLLMDGSNTANACYCQVGGTAVKLPAEAFHDLTVSDHRLRQRLDRYLQAYVNMLGRLAACNRLHSIYARCARWLLVTHDRVQSDKFPLTEHFLGMMLCTDQSGVALAVEALQGAGFIHYTDGTITISNRDGLEDAVCECYAIARDQFMGLLRD